MTARDCTLALQYTRAEFNGGVWLKFSARLALVLLAICRQKATNFRNRWFVLDLQ